MDYGLDMIDDADLLLQNALQIAGSGNGSLNILEGRLQLRRPLASMWTALLAMYGVLALSGGFTNVCVLTHVLRRSDHEDSSFRLMANLAVANIVQCGVVMPASVAVLLLQYWIFGQTLCYCMPMVQDIPLHVAMLTFLLIAADRYHYVFHPTKPRIPVRVCAMATWPLALCIVVPYPFYITYFDFGVIEERLEGTGLCIVNLEESMQEYMRGLFLLTYVLPMSTMAYLHVRISQELKTHEDSSTNTAGEVNSRDDSPIGRHFLRCEECGPSQGARFNVGSERRTHKYLVSMVTAFVICMCPLMVLRLVKLVFVETSDNSAYYDVTYTLLVWFAFLHTLTTPAIFALWVMKPETKDRYRRSCVKKCDQELGPEVPRPDVVS